ncbi:MAG: CinA family protein [Acidobacteriota bacterium]|nr:CinA family protein [Acidobacteriota bacterium]
MLGRIEEAIGTPLYQVVRTGGGEDGENSPLRLPKAAALPQVVGAVLEERHWRLATAESCTGGLLARRITDLPGSSAFYVGGVVAYDNTLKRAQLGVPAAVLASRGAVSGSCAEAMARGARDRLGAEVAVSTTGIAGPSGGSADKPVGLVYIAVVSPGGERVSRHLFSGDRWIIREKAVAAALDEVRRVMAGLPPAGTPDKGGGTTP